MSENRPTILKIGGSVITDKSEELKPRTQVIDRLAIEIQKANAKNLVVVHGGGSFGHPPAQRYRIKEGYKEDSQRTGFCETHHNMTLLNGLFMDALLSHSALAVSMAASSCIVTKNGRIHSLEVNPLKKLLGIGFLPVTYGDTVLDTELGFTILSGDQLVSCLATGLDARRVIIGVDVDGLFEADPKVEKKARLLEELNLQDLKRLQGKLGGSTSCDVTGGMLGKATELIPAIERGIEVTIINASKPNYVYATLKGETVRGTTIKKD